MRVRVLASMEFDLAEILGDLPNGIPADYELQVVEAVANSEEIADVMAEGISAASEKVGIQTICIPEADDQYEAQEVVRISEQETVSFSAGSYNKHTNSCLRKARDDEPVFVLLGRDPISQDIVAEWAKAAMTAGHNPRKVVEAMFIATVMQQYPKKSPS